MKRELIVNDKVNNLQIFRSVEIQTSFVPWTWNFAGICVGNLHIWHAIEPTFLKLVTKSYIEYVVRQTSTTMVLDCISGGAFRITYRGDSRVGPGLPQQAIFTHRYTFGSLYDLPNLACTSLSATVICHAGLAHVTRIVCGTHFTIWGTQTTTWNESALALPVFS